MADMEKTVENLESLLAAMQELVDLMKIRDEKVARCIEKGIPLPASTVRK